MDGTPQGAMDGGAAHPDYRVVQEQLPNDSGDKVEQLPRWWCP